MTKPFGKPVHHGVGLTRGLRLTLAVWGAAIPAYLLCRWSVRTYPTLAEDPFLWSSGWAFGLLYALSLLRWLNRRPTPHAPGTRPARGLGLARLLLAVSIAAPAGIASGFLYEPAFTLANALGSPRRPVVEQALVERQGADWILHSPYWGQGYCWKIPPTAKLPPDLAAGSLATITLRPGLLGARWIESLEFTVLK